MAKRILLVVLGVFALLAGAALVYYLQLTAPVEVSSTPPSAATIAVAGRLPASPTAAPTSQPTTIATVPVAEAQPSPTTVVAQAESTPTEPPEPPARTLYRIDAARSQASYTVDETFFDARGLVTVVGTTNAVAGEILFDRANPPASEVGEIVVDVSQLRTDDPSRDNAIRRAYLESLRYPLATFRNATLSDMPAQVSEGITFTFKMTGDLTVRDVIRQVTWDVEAAVTSGELTASAATAIKLTDFGISPPSLSILRVEDDMVLRLDIVAPAVQ
jgi:polyisoprenoid-binding protein YceI